MKPVVDAETCIGCALCTEICPKVFEMGDDDLAHVISAEACSDAGCCEEAVEECPVEAITIKKD